MALEADTVIDARLKANNARFINHSCDPNCVTVKWNVLGKEKNRKRESTPFLFGFFYLVLIYLFVKCPVMGYAMDFFRNF